MTAVAQSALDALYADGDDPWDFRTSAYERERFDATVAVLPRSRYASALEIGCGNGELARRISLRCGEYAGIDAVEAALAAARRAVPKGRFERGFLPCDLPGGAHDLVVVSEVLYFLDALGIRALAAQIDRRWPQADVVCVTWRGPSGNPLEGEEALDHLIAATARQHEKRRARPLYRIDLFAPVTR